MIKIILKFIYKLLKLINFCIIYYLKTDFSLLKYFFNYNIFYNFIEILNRKFYLNF